MVFPRYFMGFRTIYPVIGAFIGMIIFDALVTKVLVNSTSLKIGGGGLLVVVVLIVIIFWFQGKEAAARIAKEGRTRVGNIILGKLKKWKLTARLVSNWAGKKYTTIPGELPPALKKLRLELYTLMNYMLRHEIFRAKHLALEAMLEDVSKKEEHMQKEELDERELHKHLKRWVEGAEIDPRTWELKAEQYGIARMHILIYEFMKELRSVLQENLLASTVTPDAMSYVSDKKGTVVNVHMTKFKNAYNTGYKASIMRFKILNYVRAKRLQFLDMLNMYGAYVRGYGFARKDSIPQLCTYDIASDDDVIKSIDWKEVIPVGDGDPSSYEPGTDLLVEVNLYGYAVSDINTIQVERKDVPFIRKFRKEDIVWFPKEKLGRFNHVLTFSVQDWKAYIQDMEANTWHPYDRTLTDYDPLINAGNLNFEKARFNGLLLSDRQIGFDVEALKNPSRFIYWGRKHFYDMSTSAPRSPPANPYPGISLLGLWFFIQKVAERHTKETELIRTYLNDYFSAQYEFLPELRGGQQQPRQP